MLCKKCGFGLGIKANFCPSCGNSVTDEDRVAVQPRNNPAKWLKVLSAFIAAGLIGIFLGILFSDNMTDNVFEQLKAVKENRLADAYYGYTSKSFRDATPFDKFKEYMNAYPVFSKNESVRFIDRNSEHDRGTLKAMIMTPQGVEIPVQYQLVKENDKWHIESIKLVASDTKASEAFDSRSIEASIQKQMGLIRENHLKKAYEEYTASDFRKNTTYDQFEEFIKNNPNFTENISLKLHGLMFDNNIASMVGILKQPDGALSYLGYDLVQEDGKWKVLHIKMVDSGVAGSELVFSKFVVGTAVDEDNIVSSPQTILKNGKMDDIYFNLSVEGIKTGTEIEVVFEHLDSQSTIDPVSKRVSDDGSAILTFVFSPPPGGWPKGNYRLLVSSSTGERGSYDFKIEE